MLARLLLIAAMLVGAGAHAWAEPRHAFRYDMVRLHGGRAGQVLILDRQTGQLWTWSERSAAIYAGQIFPVTADGSFARVIHVPQDER